MAALVLCALASLALLGAAEVDECQVYYGGLVFPEGARRNHLEHGLHWSKTQSMWGRKGRTKLVLHCPSSTLIVSKPAPDWNGTAVVDGEFKELTLKDFRGIPHCIECLIQFHH